MVAKRSEPIPADDAVDLDGPTVQNDPGGDTERLILKFELVHPIPLGIVSAGLHEADGLAIEAYVHALCATAIMAALSGVDEEQMTLHVRAILSRARAVIEENPNIFTGIAPEDAH